MLLGHLAAQTVCCILHINKEATMTNIQYSLFVSLLPLADHLSFLISTPRLFTPQTIKFNFMPCDTVVQLGTIPPLRISQHVGMVYTLQLLPWFSETINLMVPKTWSQKYSLWSLLLSWLYCSSKEPKFVSNGYYSTAFLWDGRVAPFWLILSWMDSYCELHWGDNSMFICQG